MREGGGREKEEKGERASQLESPTLLTFVGAHRIANAALFRSATTPRRFHGDAYTRRQRLRRLRVKTELFTEFHSREGVVAERGGGRGGEATRKETPERAKQGGRFRVHRRISQFSHLSLVFYPPSPRGLCRAIIPTSSTYCRCYVVVWPSFIWPPHAPLKSPHREVTGFFQLATDRSTDRIALVNILILPLPTYEGLNCSPSTIIIAETAEVWRY